MPYGGFSWDERKNAINKLKHGIGFEDVLAAFADQQRVIDEDVEHSTKQEPRYFCFGRVGNRICTVRFTYRDQIIRIYGAGFWRQGQRRYYDANHES
jgi:uncharacterized protein